MNTELFKRPDHWPVDVVLDTDTYNEVDDQFALAYLLQCPERIHMEAVFAAPFYDSRREFYNYKSDSVQEGMEKSYDEIMRLLTLMHRDDMKTRVFKGSTHYISETGAPVDSPAARCLIELAMEHTSENPLYVIGIGSPTNIASALIMEPEIAKRIVVVWMGGASLDWPSCREFNLSQDLKASQELFKPEVRLVQIPGMGVSSAFAISSSEFKEHLLHKNALCDYLVTTVFDAMNDPSGKNLWSRIIWDVCAAAWLTGDGFVLDRPEIKPMPGETQYEKQDTSALERYVYYIQRDALAQDLFRKLSSPTKLTRY